jgi:hypothetical protein
MMAIVKGMNDPCAVLQHDPEKSGFQKDHAQTRRWSMMTTSHHAPAACQSLRVSKLSA